MAVPRAALLIVPWAVAGGSAGAALFLALGPVLELRFALPVLTTMFFGCAVGAGVPAARLIRETPLAMLVGAAGAAAGMFSFFALVVLDAVHEGATFADFDPAALRVVFGVMPALAGAMGGATTFAWASLERWRGLSHAAG